MKPGITLNGSGLAVLAGGAILLAAALGPALPGRLAGAEREVRRHRPEARAKARGERGERTPVLSEQQAARLRALRREIAAQRWEREMAAAGEKLGLSEAQIEKLRAMRAERLELADRLIELRERRLERLRSEVGLSDEQIAGLRRLRGERAERAMKEVRRGRGYGNMRGRDLRPGPRQLEERDVDKR